MHRIAAWRLGFELQNLKKLVSKSDGTVKYFAFGANLDPSVLKETRRITPTNEKSFILKDYALSFSHPAAFEGMGFASIEKERGAMVYGKLYSLSLLDAVRLDYYELVPFLHRYKRVTVKQDGEVFFFYQSCDPRSNLKPTKKYLDYIVSGFKKSTDIPVNYTTELENTKTFFGPPQPAKDLGFFKF